jgi:hypothetical protein
MNLRLTYSCLALIYLFCQELNASDTLHVITHNRQTVVTDPSKGFKEYKSWGVFPSAKTPVRKVILHLHFGCPDSMRCADWDYLDFISIKRVNGVNGVNKDFEIARMLTPYGGAFNKDWKFDWELDVTDFSLLLRDSVEIEYNHSGYESNKDRGWQITVDFEIIKGQPAIEPLSIEKVYSGSFKYGDTASPIESFLKPFSFGREKGASFAKFRIYQTGHGDNSADECGEFCSKKRDIVFNGEVIDTRPIWKKCGDNPLFPQAGTWILDRANWCPGYLQIPDEYLLPLKDINSIDVNMEPYETAKSEAVENITAYLVQYRKTKTKNDASIEDVLVPSVKKTSLRTNPACANGRILIRNNGQKDLNKLLITYGTIGFSQKTYWWKGKLAPGGQILIELPGGIDANKGSNTYIVILSNPNGKPDEFTADNKMISKFERVPIHGKDLVLLFKTNNQPNHNSYAITSAAGDLVYHHRFDSTAKDRLFKDTLHLEDGCYLLHIIDTAGDGLEFWYNTEGGRGYTRLQDLKSNLLKAFESDFGSELTYSFMVSGDTTQWSSMNTQPAIGLYPTRTNGKTTLDYFGGIPKDITVQIITDDGGKLVEEHHYNNVSQGNFTYDLSYRPAQRYYLKVFVDGEQKFNKRIRVVDEPIK